MSTALSNIKTALVNTVEPIDIQVTDAAGMPVDATTLNLTIMDMGSTILWTDSYTTPPAGGSKIIKPATTTGYYYYPFGSIVPNAQTNVVGDYIFQWQIATAASQLSTITQNVKVITAQTMYQIPYLRLTIDKARKYVDPANDVFLGYTDAQLVAFLEGGLQIINGYQPESIFTLDTYPWRDFRHLAIESALMAGVLSQQLFSLDTDMPNYSDQGTQFVINHQPALAAILNQVTQRLDKAIPAFKLQFVQTGSIHLQMGGGYGLNMLVSAAPRGSLFRNMYFKG